MEHRSGCYGGDDCRCEEETYWRVLAIAIFIFMMEWVGGWLVGSLALVSDALHVLVDGFVVVMAIGVAWMSRKGIKGAARTRVICGAVSAAFLLSASFWIFDAALDKISYPGDIKSWWMLSIAAAGWFGNHVQHYLLHELEEEGGNITHTAMMFHVDSDKWQSAAITVGGAVIMITGWTVIDPLLSFCVALYMLYGSGVILGKCLREWR